MWWEPRTGVERELRATVDRLLRQYQEYLGSLSDQSEQKVYGVGSRVTPTGEWRPLLLVDISVVAGGADFLASLLTSEAIRGDADADGLVFEYAGAHDFRHEEQLADLLGPWDLPSGTLIKLTTKPSPARIAPLMSPVISPGSVVRGSQAPRVVGTVGTTGTWGRVQAFFTAGHCVTGAGDRVELVPGQIPAGTVVEHWDPIGKVPAGEWDAAVVVSDLPIKQLVHSGLRPAPTLPTVPFNVTVHTGRGRFTGSVNGALAQLGDLTRQWLACWSLGPSHLLVQGDSGAVGVDDIGRIVGHFVGGNLWPGYPTFNDLFLQDFNAFASMSGTHFII